MLKCILFLLFTLNSILSYGSQNTFDESLQRTNQNKFFTDQNDCLQKSVEESSIVYEVRQRLVHKGIQMLHLLKLDIHIGGNKLSESELNSLFDDQRVKFENKIAKDFNGTVANTTILINLRAKRKLPDGRFSEPKNISYFTTPDVFLSCKNLAEYCDQLAILNEWTYYSDFTIAIIPKGARLQALIGLTAAQESIPKQYTEIVKEVGEEKAHHYTPKSGGAPQIYIAHVSEYQVYDMGSIATTDFKKIRVRNVLNINSPIYLPVLEFLNIKFYDSFKKVHSIINTVRKSPYYANPFSIAYSEINSFVNLFCYSNKNQQKISSEMSSIQLLRTSHPNTKAIIPYKERPKVLLVLYPRPTNLAVHASLRNAYIAPFIARAIRLFK